jgi:hypothetical protein
LQADHPENGGKIARRFTIGYPIPPSRMTRKAITTWQDAVAVQQLKDIAGERRISQRVRGNLAYLERRGKVAKNSSGKDARCRLCGQHQRRPLLWNACSIAALHAATASSRVPLTFPRFAGMPEPIVG